jgi:hypothetical protein
VEQRFDFPRVVAGRHGGKGSAWQQPNEKPSLLHLIAIASLGIYSRFGRSRGRRMTDRSQSGRSRSGS